MAGYETDDLPEEKDWLADIKERKTANEKIKVVVFRRPNMFKVNENMYNLIGYGELEKLFTIENYKSGGGALQLYYPERFLNIVEQRVLVDRIADAGYEEAQIFTNSAFIVQSSSNVGIYESEDENLSEKQFKLSHDYVGMPDDSGLNVL